MEWSQVCEARIEQSHPKISLIRTPKSKTKQNKTSKIFYYSQLVVSTHLENMLVKLDHFPQFSGLKNEHPTVLYVVAIKVYIWSHPMTNNTPCTYQNTPSVQKISTPNGRIGICRPEFVQNLRDKNISKRLTSYLQRYFRFKI